MKSNELKVLRLPAVMEKTGLRRATVYLLMTKGLFPSNFKIGSRAAGWLESDINEWIMDCVRASREE
jgi:prophage regulatory protein